MTATSSHHHLPAHLHAWRLGVALTLTSALAVAQIVVAVLSHSLAVASDAGHLGTDVVGLGLSVAAVAASRRHRPGERHTFGLHRLEILAALANAVLMVGVATLVSVQAIVRWSRPPAVGATTLAVIGTVGLVVNAVSFTVLHTGRHESLNLRGAYLEVLADLLGSLGVLTGAVVLATTGWRRVDPLVGVAIGIFIVPRALRLGRDAVGVLVQAAPRHVPVAEVRAALSAVPGVVDLHDLHLWTLSSGIDVASVHLHVGPTVATAAVVEAARAVLTGRFGIERLTIQVDQDPSSCPDLVS
jgi:cobalt-zinc-cadmium efflux system protein